MTFKALEMLFHPAEADLLKHYINQSIRKIESGNMKTLHQEDIENLNILKEKIDWFTDADVQ